MNGKGRGPEKGYNRQAYADNYDRIFRKTPNPTHKEPMNTNDNPAQPAHSAVPNPHPVLPWHREAAKEIDENADNGWLHLTENIIARHDPHASRGIELDRCIERRDLLTAQLFKLNEQHAETLRLLAAAEHYVPGNAVTADWQTKPLDECRLLDKIRAHLAAHSKPFAMQQSAKQEGRQ